MSEVGRLIMDKAGQEAITRSSMLWLFTPKFILERNAFVQQIEQMALQFATHPEVFERQLDALLEHDVREQLGRLDIPTQVMCGRRDIMVPPELAEELAATIPGADFKLLDGGHAYNLEEFDAFNRTVLEFLQAH